MEMKKILTILSRNTLTCVGIVILVLMVFLGFAAPFVASYDPVTLDLPARLHCLAPVLIQMTLGIGEAIVTAASLSFIGLGAQPPTPECGAMISTARLYALEQWWYAAFPGMDIFITVVGFNLLGDGVRDILDPRSKS